MMIPVIVNSTHRDEPTYNSRDRDYDTAYVDKSYQVDQIPRSLGGGGSGVGSVVGGSGLRILVQSVPVGQFSISIAAI